MEFRALASSSAGNCYLVSAGGRDLLLDAGIKYPKIQRALKHDFSKLDGALISHFHGDHVAGLKGLLEAGVDCYASAETWNQLGIRTHRAKTITEKKPLLIVLADGSYWKISAFEVPHDAPGTYGFIVYGPGNDGKLLYLTDTAYAPGTVKDLTHIAIECNYMPEQIRENSRDGYVNRERYKRTVQSHMSLPNLLKWLNAVDLSKCQEIWLLHLSDANSDEKAMLDAVQRATGKVVRVAPKEVLL
jgi:phosphoribosyl 1,2-cyclic phosphodiesterase